MTVGAGQNVGPLAVRCGPALLEPMGVQPPPRNACQIGQVSIAVAKVNPGNGNQSSVYIGIRNAGDTDCSLLGYPGVAARHTTGPAVEVLHQGSYEIPDPVTTLVDLQPGRSAYFGVGWLDVDPPCAQIQSLDVSLPAEPGGSEVPLAIAACASNGTTPILDVTTMAAADAFTGGAPPP